jgi:HlyD family secretion protein
VADTFFREGEYVARASRCCRCCRPTTARRFYVPEAERARPGGPPVSLSCDGCGAPIAARISRIAPQAEYTPPVIYSNSQRSKLVFQVEALPAAAERAAPAAVGQPREALARHEHSGHARPGPSTCAA